MALYSALKRRQGAQVHLPLEAAARRQLPRQAYRVRMEHPSRQPYLAVSSHQLQEVLPLISPSCLEVNNHQVHQLRLRLVVLQNHLVALAGVVYLALLLIRQRQR